MSNVTQQATSANEQLASSGLSSQSGANSQEELDALRNQVRQLQLENSQARARTRRDIPSLPEGAEEIIADETVATVDDSTAT